MTDKILLLPIIIPFLSAALSFFMFKRLKRLGEALALLTAFLNLALAAVLFNKNISFSLPWLGAGTELSFRLYNFSAFIILSTAFFGFLLVLYSVVFMRGKEHVNQFYSYLLLTLSFANGAVLADNLLVMLFFWEGLLLTIFGMIAIGNKNAFKTATKALIIVGLSDLCMMLGIIMTGHLAGTLTISRISLSTGGLASLAFILLVIGAISKAGSMPFHSWIPDASIDAPLPFMAFLPAALEKLLGIYFLTRITLDMFKLQPESWLSTLLMTIGALTIILAVMMALIQKDYKKLLSYHAISQVGYMILGIGTALPVGIIGGLFHMINNALYKSGLFLSAGAVEKQAGTTNLEKLGGIGIKMPVTFACYIITALSISGVPPFNGFFSKELVYDGALERGWIFYLAAVLGSFFTAASFLKLGHAAFLGKRGEGLDNVKEAPFSMLFPMIVIALTCVVFGVYNALPISLIQPVLGELGARGRSFSGMPANIMLVVITLVVLALALLNHLWGAKRKGSGLKAVDHIHYAPLLSGIYDKAEKRFFDPYDLGLKFTALFSRVAWASDRGIDWLYNGFSVGLASAFTRRIKKLHTGNYSAYVIWCILGLVIAGIFLLRSV